MSATHHPPTFTAADGERIYEAKDLKVGLANAPA